MKQDYYIGLDMGTESVGWAVTDVDYNLVKKRGQDYWGVYLFDEAKTAQGRRASRTNRRRLARVRHRLNLLQELFDSEISAKDFGFFYRLENSKYFDEDKPEIARGKFLLFNDKDFGDKEYYKNYPTIFHLRNALRTQEIKDVRLLYLAVHHILKNRGHFLFGEQDFKVNDASDVSGEFEKINRFLRENDGAELDREKIPEIFETLCNVDLAKRERKEKILKLSGNSKNKLLGEALNAVVGLEFSLSKMFGEDRDFQDIKKMSFTDSSFEEKLAKARMALDDDEADFLETLKKVQSVASLHNILHGKEFISQAKTETYETHRRDLSELKKYVRENCPEKYALVFRRQVKKGKKNTSGADENEKDDKKVNNYAAYIGMDKGKGFEKCKKEDFYAFLKKEIGINDESLLAKIDEGIFLPKQISAENCDIPYQVHLAELKAILANAENYFPFLKQKDENCEMTVSEKIISLMKFRVPYYVGPFTDKETRFSWMIKKEGVISTQKITPWNFDDVVDRDASEQKFIKRMTNFCTYLTGEKVLPASSFLYSEYAFLNELNNLKVNGTKDLRVKNILFDFAKTNKKLTLKKCCEQLVKNGLLPEGSKARDVFSGTDGDFKNSLSSYIDFKRIIGDKADLYRDMCEEIISWITVISDKERLVKIIKDKYGTVLSDEEIKGLKALNYTKWGRLSKKLLDGIFETDSEGEVGNVSIIEKMRTDTENFMELLSNRHNYKRAIDLANSESVEDKNVTYRAVEELYCSPAVKRSIWSALKIVSEIKKVQGYSPKKIFVETTREKPDGTRKGKRTVSRKQRLLDVYRKNLRNEKELIKKIEETEDSKFNSDEDKLFFYFTQMGKDAYTGEKIELDDLSKTEIYDIDHIYPRSKIKDDSLDNRVLTRKKINQGVKQDIYPLPAEIRNKMEGLWRQLKDKKLISEEKFYRLTRSTPLTEKECGDFINAQLVATSQSAKAAIQLLKRMLPESEIVYSKAGNVNEFKNRLKFVKIRELNDLHHAKDAYFNIVVGNVFNTKFNHNAAVFLRNNGTGNYDLKRLYDFDITNAWKAGDENRIRSVAEKNTCRVVRFSKTEKGQFYKVTICPAGKNDKLAPIKGNGPLNDTSKYGGYDKETTAYFMLVKSRDKKKKDKTLLSLECVTVLADKNFRTAEDKLKYCEKELGLKEPEILIEKIKLNTLFKINGSYAWIRGRTGDRLELCNANQLWLDNGSAKELKKISNHFRDVKKYKDLPVREEEISKEQNLALYDLFTEKLGGKIYAGLSIKGQIENLEKGRDKFEALELKDQLFVLMEILKFMQCNSMTSNIKLIGGAENAGKNRISKLIQDSDVKMISCSPTGYFCKVVDFKRFL